MNSAFRSRLMLTGFILLLGTACATTKSNDDSFSRELVAEPPSGEEAKPHPLPAGPALMGNFQTRQAEPLLILTESGESLQQGVLQREDVDAFLAHGPAYMLSWVDLEPAHEGQKFLGFKLVKIHPSVNPALRLGLHEGDIIVSLQGVAVREPGDLHSAWESMTGTEEIVLSVIRQGQAHQLKWQVVSETE